MIGVVRALAESIRLIENGGFDRHARKISTYAAATREAFRAMGVAFFPLRSPSPVLTVLKLPDGVDGTAVIRHSAETHGVYVSDGQEAMKGKIIRIGHIGHLSREDVVRGIRAVGDSLNEVGGLDLAVEDGISRTGAILDELDS